ncbi:MAG: hypothetical protein RIF46_11495 [Cyclobacteriaceae bacterium]
MKQKTLILGLALATCSLVSCGDDDTPPKENEEEVIDLVTLTFTPDEGSAVVFTATDPDGAGVADMAPDGAITLNANTTYTLAIELENTEEDEDITAEVEEEGDEHIFFFSFTTDIFSDPAGNGNIDARADAVNYLDEDVNDEPIGLSTSWTTGTSSSDGTFRVVLKHQPDIKSATSTSTDGETDIDISWTINIQSPIVVIM